MKVTADLPNFAEEIRQLVDAESDLPPVESWSPSRSGEIDIRIDRQGDWYYRGEKMERESIVRLFSKILRKEESGYFLVTPVEKLRISVEDVPFIVRLMDVAEVGRDQTIYFSTNAGDHFSLGGDNVLKVVYDKDEEPVPYVKVRASLFARLAHSVYYELADLAEESSSEKDTYGVWSEGVFHCF